MKRTIIVAIVSVLFFSIITNNSYAESLYVDAQLGELKKIENSKYKATALNVVRNSDGELRYEAAPNGDVIPQGKIKTIDPVHGEDLILTIE